MILNESDVMCICLSFVPLVRTVLCYVINFIHGEPVMLDQLIFFSYQDQITINSFFVKMWFPEELNHHAIREFSHDESICPYREARVWLSLGSESHHVILLSEVDR